MAYVKKSYSKLFINSGSPVISIDRKDVGPQQVGEESLAQPD
jgi:hypothetical protein